MLKCGMSEIDITPPLGNSMPGYFVDRKSTGIRDALHAKAWAVESNGYVTAFAALDCIDIRQVDVMRIRERVHSATGIPPERVMVSATHTHTGPPVKPGFSGAVNETYMTWLAEKAADAVIVAYRNRTEARLGFGRGHEADIAFNRRFRMKDGTYRTNPGALNPDILEAVGSIDPEVLVIRIDDANGRPLGLVTNYAVHSDCVGGTEYSADYPGELSRAVKRQLGEHAVSLFMLGACGNINHIDVSGRVNTTADRYLRMGRILAGEALKVREKAGWDAVAEAPLRCGQSIFPVAYRKPSPQELERAEAAVSAPNANEVELVFARQVRMLQESRETGTDIEIQAVALGEAAIVALPCELFVEFGLELKRRSPFPFTIVCELANGSASGYVCTREAHAQGGYEPRITSSSKLSIEAGYQFVDKALELLRQLHETH